MKNEQRQQRAKNDLANMLENGINQLKDHSALIMRTILIILIAVLIFLVWRNLESRNKRGFYNDVKQLAAYDFTALDAEQFDTYINDYVKKYPSGANHATVSVLIGDIYFNQATTTLAKGERDKAIGEFETALKYYTTADKFQFKHQQQDLAESAVWGLAQTHAALATLKEGDDFAASKDSFERLCKTWPDGTYNELATEQLEWLNRPVMGTFAAKYRQVDPVLFAPNMETPETTTPIGDLDTSMAPGDIDINSFLDKLNADGGHDGENGDDGNADYREIGDDGQPVFDPGLTLPTEQPESHETQGE